MGSGSLSTGRKPWEYQNSSQGCVWVSVYKLKCVQKKEKKNTACARDSVGFAWPPPPNPPTTSVPHGEKYDLKSETG